MAVPPTKTRPFPRRVLACLLLAGCAASTGRMQTAWPDLGPSTVVVLGLRHLRFDMKGFEAMDERHLSETLQRLRPDIVALEINPEWLDAFRADEPATGLTAAQIRQAMDSGETKVILGLASEKGWRVVGIGAESIEESERQRKDEAALSIQEHGKGMLDAFDRFVSTFYNVINRDFRTFAAVNSPEYDRLMEIKHRYTAVVKYHYWESRNARMVDLICRVARSHPGKRIVVTVGAEHGHALRHGLDSCPATTQLSMSRAQGERPRMSGAAVDPSGAKTSRSGSPIK